MQHTDNSVRAPVRVNAFDLAYSIDALSAALMRVDAVARLHAGERAHLLGMADVSGGEVLQAWSIAIDLLNSALTEAEAAAQRMSARARTLVLALDEIDANRVMESVIGQE